MATPTIVVHDRYLNYEAVGKKFQAEQVSAFPGGCFIANCSDDSKMQTPYSGNPPVPDLRPDHVFRLLLECSLKDGRPVWLNLPASGFDMNQAAQQIGWESLSGRRFIRCRSSIPMLDKTLTGSENIYTLSDFAEHLQYLRNAGELPKYKAALEIAGYAGLDDCITLAENLEKYAFYPEIISEYDYGEWELIGAYNLDRTCPGMEHFNFTAFGKERMNENGVVSTPYGMIRRIGPEQEMTQQDSQSDTLSIGMQFN